MKIRWVMARVLLGSVVGLGACGGGGGGPAYIDFNGGSGGGGGGGGYGSGPITLVPGDWYVVNVGRGGDGGGYPGSETNVAPLNVAAVGRRRRQREDQLLGVPEVGSPGRPDGHPHLV